MSVVPVVQSRRRSERVRFGFPQNSFVVTRYRRDRNTNNPIDLMLGETEKELNEVVFPGWVRPSNGKEFKGYDIFKLNELEYPDYTKVKCCDAYVKLDDGKGVSQPKWWPYRAKTFAGFEENVQDGKKVKVPKYVCVPVNSDTLQDVPEAADVTVPAYRLRFTGWRPFTEEAPDYEVPFPERTRQSKKRKGVPQRKGAPHTSESDCKRKTKKKAVPHTSKSKSKRKKKKYVVSKKRDDNKNISETAAAVDTATAAYNNILSRAAVTSAVGNKRKKIPHISQSNNSCNTNNPSTSGPCKLRSKSEKSGNTNSTTVSVGAGGTDESNDVDFDPENFVSMVRGLLFGVHGRNIMTPLQAVLNATQTHHCDPERFCGENLSVYKCSRKRGRARVEIYVPTLIRNVIKIAGKPAPKNIRIPIHGVCHAENKEFLDFVTNYVTSETDSMTLPEKQTYISQGYQVQSLKNGRVKVIGHDLIDNIMCAWNQTCILEVEEDDARTGTC